MIRLLPVLTALGLWAGAGLVAASTEARLERRVWTVDGREREALMAAANPAKVGGTSQVPVVLVFHGHGGSMRQAAQSIPVFRLWPEACVVYPQGLPTTGQLTDPEGRRAGWQRWAGDQEDRDLKFVDAILASLSGADAGTARPFLATGHSNGGAFTYLLWAERGERFAAFAPSAAAYSRVRDKLVPRPVLHLGSTNDPLVKPAWQMRMIDHVLAVNQCGPRRPGALGYVEYPSKVGALTATFIHEGGHRFPIDATEHIVRFFQARLAP